MKEEKMMILTMLEEGKITSEEAIKLMEALEEMESVKKTINLNEEKKSSTKEKSFTKQLFDTSKPFLDTLEDIGSDIGNVLGDIGSELGNTFGDIGTDLGGTISKVFGGLKDLGINMKGNYESINTELDMDISDIKNPSLDLRAVNGSIRIRPYDEDKIYIKSVCQYKNEIISPDEPYFDFYIEDERIIFNPKYNSNISIKLDVSLPKRQYDEIVLNSSNGKIDIEGINSNTLKSLTTNSSIDVVDFTGVNIDLITKNGRIECRDLTSNILKATTTNSSIYLMDVTSSEIEAKTGNSKIEINDVYADKIICKTSNASINAEDVNSRIIHLITSNGRIKLDDIDMDIIDEIKLITSNASIYSGIFKEGKDIYFDLETSMGNITLDIPNLVYKLNKQANLGFKKIIAHNFNFDENKDHLKFTAATSNGSIKIS